MKKNYNYIYYIKLLAIMLVLNSHMDNLYPISSLAFGGAIGNSLFFLTSGYTWSNIKTSKFIDWFLKKIKRIWIPTLITNILFLILLYKGGIDFLSIFKIFVYPNKSWFCGAIILYSILYYFMVKKDNKYINIFTIGALILTYIAYYCLFLDKSIHSIESFNILNLCRIVFYFICMYLGHIIHKHQDKLSKHVNKYIIISIISFIFVILYKVMSNKYGWLYQIQFIEQILTLIFSIGIFRVLQLSENKLPESKTIKLIAQYSWEIYLTQTLIIPFCENMLFPLNIFVVIILILVSAFILQVLVKSLFKLLHLEY